MSKWIVDITKDFQFWFDTLDDDAKVDITAYVTVLAEVGPGLGRPYVDTLIGSRHKNMKELRPQSKGRPFRILFAFDPRRTAILLLGGNKEGNDRFYKELIRKADELFAIHLRELELVKNEKNKGKSKKK